VKIIRTNHLWRRKQPDRLKLRGTRLVAVWASAFSWLSERDKEKERNWFELRSQREHSLLFESLQEKATDLTWNYVNATGTILNLLRFHFSENRLLCLEEDMPIILPNKSHTCHGNFFTLKFIQCNYSHQIRLFYTLHA